jgi:hypothetical protein
MGSGKVFIVVGRLFIYIMKIKGPKIDPLRKISVLICFFVFVFCQDLNQLATPP